MAEQGPAGKAEGKEGSSGSGDMWPGRNRGMLFGCAEMASGRPRHGQNKVQQGMWGKKKRKKSLLKYIMTL